MADNWGKTVGTIQLGGKTSLEIKTGAEFKGGKFIVLSKYINLGPGKYNGPAKGGSLLIPESQKETLKEIIAGL